MAISIPSPSDPERLMAEVGDAVGTRFGAEFVMSAAYPVQQVDIDATVASRQISLRAASEFNRWQCLVGRIRGESEEPESADLPWGGGRLAAADIAETGETYSVVSIKHGDIAEAVNRAIGIAAEMASDADYRFVTISSPELHFTAVRMIALDDRHDDVYIPLVDLDLPPDDGNDLDSVQLRPLAAEVLSDLLVRSWRGRGEDPTPDSPEPVDVDPGGTGAAAAVVDEERILMVSDAPDDSDPTGSGMVAT